MRRRTRTVWLVVFPGSELLDVSGPWEVFGHTNDVLGREDFAMQLVAPRGGEIRTRHGVVIGGVRTLPVRPTALPDIAIVAGGSPQAPLPGAEATLVPWLRRHQSRIGSIVSICTGAFVLGEAGLLDGRRATTHWRFRDDLRVRFPRARVVDDGIFVRDGRLWTSAGITAGIDLTLALVEETHGHDVAMTVAKRLVLFLRRSGSQSQFSSALRRQQKEPAPLRGLSSFVLEHIDEQLPVERLAHAIGTSTRSLVRWCKDQLGESPSELVRRHRVEEAQRLLEHTQLPLKDVAARSGFGDASTLWRTFLRVLGVSPATYRDRFGATSLDHTSIVLEPARLRRRSARRVS
jgi:transcriptional regulator GlxA family with amidase domain